MAKLVLSDITSFLNSSVVTINDNWAAIEAAFENTLSRDGMAPNAMLVDFDMNSKRIINLPPPVGANDAARFADVQSAVSVAVAPSMVGNSGKVLSTDGSVAIWQDVDVILGDELAASADKLPYFDSATNLVLTPFTSFARTFLDDATAGAVLTTLGVSAFIQTLLDDADAATARTTLGAQAVGQTITTISGNTTLTASDVKKVNIITTTADVTLPAASALSDGDTFHFKSTTEGDVTIIPAGVDTIDGVTAEYRLPSFCDCTIMRSGAGAFVILEKPDVSVGDWSWGGYGTANRGWAKAGSGDKSRTTLAGLFAVYSTTWGAGNGSTTFGIPDARGRSPVQAGTGTATASGVDADVDITANEFVVPSNTRKWITGMPVNFTLSSGTITGLVSTTNYFVIRMSATRVSLASTLANAQNAIEIDFTAKSSPVWALTHTYEARTLGDYGGEEAHAMSITELLSHRHTQNPSVSGDAGNLAGGPVAGTQFTGFSGGNAAMNIMQPFLTGELYIKT